MDYPNAFEKFRKGYPELGLAYEKLGEAAKSAGPLNERERRLLKLALSLGVGLEGATHSHARRALEAGISRDELQMLSKLDIWRRRLGPPEIGLWQIGP